MATVESQRQSAITSIRELETFVLDRLPTAPADASVEPDDRQRFLALSCDLELAIRTLAREFHRMHRDIISQRDVVVSAMGWYGGQLSEGELRAAIAAYLEDGRA